MDGAALRAYTSFRCQRARCYDSKNARYPWVGAYGIEVEYEAREFIGWWLEQIKLRKRWKSPTCGRIDHGQNYRFGNIELVERAENTRERNARRGYPFQPGSIRALGQNGLILHFSSIGEAARVTGVPKSLIEEFLTGKIESPNPLLIFKRGTS